jgi:single-strand selective monofunctional uracil DNA glycosylase
MTASDELVELTRRFASAAGRLRFGGAVAQAYNPLVYAWRPHELYLRRYAAGPKRAVFLGMNPGPFGMAQTGVPFGEVAAVRGWLGISAPVGRPPAENPKRPVLGFACPRSEVSGARLWGAIAELYGKPERFFSEFFVANYCPLVFMEAGGRNITPDKLPAGEREPLYALCDEYLRDSVRLLGARLVIGIGKFAEARAAAALAGLGVETASVLHPSPASPAANRGWAGQFREKLGELGLAG